jgi:hypothetical protein
MMIINSYDKNGDEKEILKNIEIDIKNYDQKIKRNKKFGIYLNPSSDIIKRRAYSKLSQIAKRRQLSDESLQWLGDFATNGPYDDIRQFFQNHVWVEQFRNMKMRK